MRRMFVLGMAVGLLGLGAAACVTKTLAILVISFRTLPADTVTVNSVTFAGQLIRNPTNLDLVKVFYARSETGDHQDTTDLSGNFQLSVPLVLESENHITVWAADETGLLTDSSHFTVVQQKPTPQAPPSGLPLSPRH